MSKARKASPKTTAQKRKPARKPRAVAALAVEEPRISTARQSRKTTTTSRPSPASVPSPVAGSAQMLEVMLQWSPWNIMLRQHAVLASMMSKMMRGKD